MAPESERAKIYVTPEEQARLWLSHNGYRTLAGGSEYVSGPPLYEIMAQYHAWMEKTEPTLTCSEVVERLANEAATEIMKKRHNLGYGFITTVAEDTEIIKRVFIDWRERRVQELEEALRKVSKVTNWEDVDEIARGALAKSDEWREQIRKGAKHE